MSRVSAVAKVLIGEIDYLFTQNQQLSAQIALLQMQLQTAQASASDSQSAEDAMNSEVQKLGLAIPPDSNVATANSTTGSSSMTATEPTNSSTPTDGGISQVTVTNVPVTETPTTDPTIPTSDPTTREASTTLADQPPTVVPTPDSNPT